MARLPYVDPATAPEEVRSVLERLPVPLNIFRMMAHAQTSFRPLLRLGTSILSQQKLSGKLRELAILRVAQLSPARYEWIQHVPIGKMVGVSEAQIAALERDDIVASCFAPDEQTVLQFASELVRDVRPTERVFAEVEQRFSPQEIVELILTIGYYMMLARLMETTAIDLEPAAGQKIVEEALKTR